MPPEPTTIAPTVPELLDKLAALGDRHHIAMHFRDLDIKGETCKSDSCAVAVYLNHATGREFIVGNDEAVAWQAPGPDYRTALPEPVKDFIVAFDNREYPELIAERRAHPCSA